MPDERDISREIKWLYEERAKTAVNSLRRRHINAQYVSDHKEALSAVMAMIPAGATVSRGESLTLRQIGVIDELSKRSQIKFLDPFPINEDGTFILDPQARARVSRESFFADVFLTGTNAVTLDGKLVNIDGLGNRVAALIFGPAKVIVVAGANKIVKDVDEGIQRIHQVTAPMNARRHYLKHRILEYSNLPCAKTGICADCTHEYKICNYIVIIEGSFYRARERINVVLVGEALGI